MQSWWLQPPIKSVVINNSTFLIEGLFNGILPTYCISAHRLRRIQKKNPLQGNISKLKYLLFE